MKGVDPDAPEEEEDNDSDDADGDHEDAWLRFRNPMMTLDLNIQT
ncbi:hypothetical protein M8C21_027486 [Ambrosia artemisiifolia]|uniref:Uncharacterized protein n=1 Tax=Ambrosia artemisiifolia TaxID=4212 RepID=A0AAD5GJ51_AMBAR|nr:hypothetical protein M8C21_027486 [Ambrosia artemisiifolia]